MGEGDAEQAEDEQVETFQPHGEAVAAAEAVAFGPEDGPVGMRRAQEEGDDDGEGDERAFPVAEKGGVGRAGHRAGDVGGVALHGEEAAGVDGAGDKGHDVAEGAEAAVGDLAVVQVGFVGLPEGLGVGFVGAVAGLGRLRRLLHVGTGRVGGKKRDFNQSGALGTAEEAV